MLIVLVKKAISIITHLVKLVITNAVVVLMILLVMPVMIPLID